MKNFYIFRHGETDFNRLGIWQGQRQNLPLNLNGESQAEELALRLANINFDIIYSSDLLRAYKTAEKVAEKAKVKIITDENFREVDVGIMDGRSKEEVKEKFPDLYEKWRDMSFDTFDFAFEEGESKSQVVNRVLTRLKFIAENTDYETVGIASHAGVIRWVAFYFGLKLSKVPNCAVIKLEFDEGEFKLVQF